MPRATGGDVEHLPEARVSNAIAYALALVCKTIHRRANAFQCIVYGVARARADFDSGSTCATRKR